MKKGLGKGLDALITPIEEKETGIIELKINKIEPNGKQPRKRFDDEKLLQLSESIKQKGIIQPIIVKKENDTYRIVAGERRWRAARIAGLSHVPVIIREFTERQLMEVALIENIQREDLNPIEEAEAFERLIKDHQLTQEDIANVVGKSRPAVANTLRLLLLDPKVKEYVITGELTSGHARALVIIEDKIIQKGIADEIIKKNLSVRETEALIKSLTQKVNKDKEKKKESEDYSYIEEKLKSVLGTKVKLSYNKGKGKIMIEYYSDEELDRILEIIENSKK